MTSTSVLELDISDTILSSHAFASRPAGLMMECFKDSKACRHALSALAETQIFFRDVLAGMKAERIHAVVIPVLAALAPAGTVSAAAILAHSYYGLDRDFVLAASSLATVCAMVTITAANTIMDAEETGRDLRLGILPKRPSPEPVVRVAG